MEDFVAVTGELLLSTCRQLKLLLKVGVKVLMNGGPPRVRRDCPCCCDEFLSIVTASLPASARRVCLHLESHSSPGQHLLGPGVLDTLSPSTPSSVFTLQEFRALRSVPKILGPRPTKSARTVYNGPLSLPFSHFSLVELHFFEFHFVFNTVSCLLFSVDLLNPHRRQISIQHCCISQLETVSFFFSFCRLSNNSTLIDDSFENSRNANPSAIS